MLTHSLALQTSILWRVIPSLEAVLYESAYGEHRLILYLSPMEIAFIGTGGAFDYEIGNSAAMLTFAEQRILIDCGHTVYPRMRQLGIAASFNYILITHLHDDHCGSLSTLIFHQKHLAQKAEKTRLLVPSIAFRDELIELLNHSQQDCTQNAEFILLSDFAKTLPQGYECGYIDTFGLHSANMRTHAYWFRDTTELLLYSGDLGTFEPLQAFLQTASDTQGRIFCDIAFNNIQTAHIYYQDAQQISLSYPIWGYHNNHLAAPSDCRIPLVGNTPSLLLS